MFAGNPYASAGRGREWPGAPLKMPEEMLKEVTAYLKSGDGKPKGTRPKGTVTPAKNEKYFAARRREAMDGLSTGEKKVAEILFKEKETAVAKARRYTLRPFQAQHIKRFAAAAAAGEGRSRSKSKEIYVAWDALAFQVRHAKLFADFAARKKKKAAKKKKVTKKKKATAKKKKATKKKKAPKKKATKKKAPKKKAAKKKK